MTNCCASAGGLIRMPTSPIFSGRGPNPKEAREHFSQSAIISSFTNVGYMMGDLTSYDEDYGD